MGKKFETNIVSKYRQEIYGFAAIWVMLSHVADYKIVNFAAAGKMGNVIETIFSHGNISVDIFLFLSGISLYYAWTKNSDLDRFYHSRINRILPSYIMIIVTVGVFQYIFDIGSKPKPLLLALSGLQIFIDGKRYVPWYASCIMLFYIIFPAIFIFIYGKSSKNHFARYMLLMLVSYGYIYSLHRLNYQYYWMVEIIVNRLPVFITGIYAGKFVKKGVKLSSFTWVGLILLVGLYEYIRLNLEGWYYRVPLIIGAIPLAYLFAGFMKLIDHDNIVCQGILKFLRQMGDISFEFYIAHVMFIRIFSIDECNTGLGLWTVGIIVSFIVSVYVRKAAVNLTRKKNLKIAQ